MFPYLNLICVFFSRMAHSASTRALAVVSVTVKPRQLSSSHVTLRVVSVLVNLESMDQTANSAPLDTGTMDLMDARVSLFHVVVLPYLCRFYCYVHNIALKKSIHLLCLTFPAHFRVQLSGRSLWPADWRVPLSGWDDRKAVRHLCEKIQRTRRGRTWHALWTYVKKHAVSDGNRMIS